MRSMGVSCVRRIGHRIAGESEIRDFSATVRSHQDVGRLDVLVNQVAVVGNPQTLDDLDRNIEHSGQIKDFFFADPVTECAAIDILP